MRKQIRITALGLALVMMFAMCSCSKPRGSGVVQDSAPSKPAFGMGDDATAIEPDVTETEPDLTEPADVEPTDAVPTDTLPTDTLPTDTTPSTDEPTATSPTRPAAAENAPVYEGTHEELIGFIKSLIGKDVSEAETMLKDFFKADFTNKYVSEHDEGDRYTYYGYYYIYDVEVNTTNLKCAPGTTTVNCVSFWILDYSKEDCAEDVEILTGLTSEECGEPYMSTPEDLDAGAGWGNYYYENEEGNKFSIEIFIGEGATSATIIYECEILT